MARPHGGGALILAADRSTLDERVLLWLVRAEIAVKASTRTFRS